MVPASSIYGFLVLTFLEGRCLAFEITLSTSSPISVFQGNPVELSCKSDGEFEFCNWKHENEYCFYEWKFASKRVEQQQCSSNIRRRVRYIGDSVKNVRECKIRLNSVSLIDQGKWRCELQEYCLGDCNGPKDVRYIDLIVNEREENFPSIGSTVGIIFGIIITASILMGLYIYLKQKHFRNFRHPETVEQEGSSNCDPAVEPIEVTEQAHHSGPPEEIAMVAMSGTKMSFPKAVKVVMDSNNSDTELSNSANTDCKICFENTDSYWILQCGHGFFCEKCSQRLLEDKNPCPICRKNITSRNRAFI